MDYKFIAVSGFGKSGSGACVDLLKEFDYIGGLDREFRMAKDPSGLIDLESSLISNWEFVRHNVAINDFVDYCRMLSRRDGLFKRTGKNFSTLLGVDFLKETEKYIDSIVDFTYYGDTLLHRYRLTAKYSFIQRMRSKFGLGNEIPMYFSRPSEDKFLFETIHYIKNLFDTYVQSNKLQMVVLDQAISPINISQGIKYFNYPKLIIVDRDPRDIYTTMVMEKRLLGADALHSITFEKYLTWHKSVRVQSEQDINNINLQEGILRLDFESFFLDYDNTLDKIKNFIGIDFVHKDKNLRFSPDTMHNHVGIWKQLPDQYTISRIRDELSNSCFINP